MAQILVTVDPGHTLQSIQRAIRKLQGVVSTSVVKETEEVPNATTLAAMKEIESGQDAGVVRVDDFESFMASMEQ